MQVAARARGIGEVLLAEQDEGALGHPAAVDLALGMRPAPRRSRRRGRSPPGRESSVRPGHAALDREVELEGAGAVPVAAVGAGDRGGRRSPAISATARRREVEEHGVGARQLGERADRAAGLDRPAVLADDGGQRSGDRLRAAARDRPAVVVPGADQHHADGRAERRRERAEGVSGDAAEQRPRLGARQGPGEQRRRRQRAAGRSRPARAGGGAGAASGRRMSSLSAPKWSEEGPKSRFQAAPAAPRPAAVASIERCIATARPPSSGCARSISGQAHSRPWRSRSSSRKAGRGGAHRVRGRAVVVQQAGQGQLAGSRAAADRRRGLDHGHPHPGLRQHRGGDEAVRAGPDDDRAAHAGLAGPGALAADSSGWTGKGRPSSQGWRSTMSATFTQPSSTRPEAASKIR